MHVLKVWRERWRTMNDEETKEDKDKDEGKDKDKDHGKGIEPEHGWLDCCNTDSHGSYRADRVLRAMAQEQVWSLF